MNKYLLSGIVAITALLGFITAGHFLYQPKQSAQSAQTPSANLGGTCTKFVGSLPTTLNGAGISTSVTSIGVTSMTIKQTGQPLSITDFTCAGGTGVGYATLEPGNTSRQEFISFTGITQNSNGSAILTGVTRGLSPVYPYTASSTMQFTHGGGTTAIISNSPPFYNNFTLQNNDATITAQYTFSSTSQPVYAGAPTFTNALALIDKNYADGLSFAGVATSSETNFGGVWLGTALQQASSTNGGANKPYVTQTKYATDTPQSSCAVGYTAKGASCIPVANLLGVLNPFWIATSSAYTYNWGATMNFTSGFTSSASSTFTATTTVQGNLVVATTTTSTNIISKNFGGTGADGALSCSSGTTTIALGSAAVVEKNYTSISITGTCAIAFSSPNSGGTIVVFRSQGPATITSTQPTGAINLSGVGGAGGVAGTGGSATGAAGAGGGGGASMTAAGLIGAAGSNSDGGSGGTGGAFSIWLYSPTALTGGGGGLGNGTAGAVSASPVLNTTYGPTYFARFVMPGSGGGGGSGQNTVLGGVGGVGGGALYMEVGGALSISSTINANASSSPNVLAASGGCGGGGGGGSIQILYNYLISNTGTYNVAGGASLGTCTHAGGAGGNGYSSVVQNIAF